MIKKILSVLALSSVAVMGLSSVSASAMVKSPLIQTDVKIVNSKNGLALRDKNCKKIASVSNKQVVWSFLKSPTSQMEQFSGAPATKTCKINGKNTKMLLVAETSGNKFGYANSKFLTASYSTKLVEDNMAQTPEKVKQYKIVSSVNIRDAKCKITSVMYSGYVFDTPNGDEFNYTTLCKLGNKYYRMIPTSIGYVSPTAVSLK